MFLIRTEYEEELSMKNKEVYEWYCRLEDKSTNNVCRKLVEKFEVTYQV